METTNKKEVKHKPYYQKRICPVCGAEYQPLRRTKIYCDDVCRKRAFLMRKEGYLDTMEREHHAKSTVNQRQQRHWKHGNVLSRDEKAAYEKSGFINAIAEIVNERGLDEKFINPSLYWPVQQTEAITNVNKYVRCLLENTLKLSRYRSIPASDLRDLANGYAHVLYSDTFERSGHPYHDFLTALHRTLSNQYRHYRNHPKLRLALKRGDKIEIIAMLHEIGKSVPLYKFSQLFHPPNTQDRE